MTVDFSPMDEQLFATFADALQVQRGAGAAVAVDVVLERDVELLGDYGQGVARVTLAHFRDVQWRPKAGDVLTMPDSTTRKVDRILEDDGWVTKAVLYG